MAIEPSYTIAEVARLAKRHRRTVERHIEQGLLRATRTRPGAHRRIAAPEVRRYLGYLEDEAENS